MHPTIKQTISLSLFLGLSCGGVFRFVTPALWAEHSENALHIPTAEYQVKKGDTISKILFEMGVGTPSSPYRIYGKDGWMERLQAMNPKITLSTIYPGQKIFIPVLESSSLAKQDVSQDTPSATDPNQCPTEGAARFEKYTVQEGDSLSSLLYKRGVGHPDSKHRIFGRYGWMQRTQMFNSNITNWDHLHVGQKIVLLYPNQGGNAETCPPKEEMAEHKDIIQPTAPTEPQEEAKVDEAIVDEHEDANDMSLAAKEPPKTQDEIVKKPEEASIEEIAALPQDMQELISIDAIASKLDKDTVADLDDEVAEKVPPQAVKKRATQVSIEDGSAPEMEKIFKNLKRTPAAYVGARAGFAFGTRDTLATKIRTYGLFAEIREGMLSGLRLRYEKAPKYQVGIGADPKESFKYERAHLGWAFDLPWTLGDMEMHITPRVGAMKMDAKVLIKDAAQPPFLQGLHADQVNTGGLEFDAEFARYFYLFRFRLGHEVPLSKSGVEVTSTRVGLDAFIKGPGVSVFGTQIVPSYMAFVAYEHLRAEQEHNIADLDLPISSFGLGIMLHID